LQALRLGTPRRDPAETTPAAVVVDSTLRALRAYSHPMLKNLLAKLRLRRYADNESHGAETTRKTARRVQDRADASHRQPRADDSPLATQTGEEPPTGSES
jgi:hypothetical protein